MHHLVGTFEQLKILLPQRTGKEGEKQYQDGDYDRRLIYGYVFEFGKMHPCFHLAAMSSTPAVLR